MIMIEEILKHANIYIWAKDKEYKYLYCNERFAEAAGLDSPEQIVGKSDHQLYWKQYADYYQLNDSWVMQGNSLKNAPDVIDTVNNIKDILINKNRLFDSNNQCNGVGGTFVDITGKQLIKKTGYYDQIKKRYCIDDEVLGKLYLTVREITVFKHILLGYSARQIGEEIEISAKTVESYIDRVRLKLQAKNKGEIITKAIQFGLTHVLYLQIHEIEAINP